MSKTTSKHGIARIEGREGVVLHGYKDSRGYLTIGCGHLVLKGEPYTLNGIITQDVCDGLLARDLANVENTINKCVTVPLSQNQFDALVSLGFNIGVHALATSTVVHKLNKKDYAGAAEAIMLWSKPKEIIRRRRTEQTQFLTPDPVSATPQSAISQPSIESNADTTNEQLPTAATPEQLPI